MVIEIRYAALFYKILWNAHFEYLKKCQKNSPKNKSKLLINIFQSKKNKVHKFSPLSPKIQIKASTKLHFHIFPTQNQLKTLEKRESHDYAYTQKSHPYCIVIFASHAHIYKSVFMQI